MNIQISIHALLKISDLEQEFNAAFPYLKLVFFSASRGREGSAIKHPLQNSHKSLAECRTQNNTGIITITPEMTVKQTDQQFRTCFGLGVQVFRQSGKVWLETTVTDCWTLREQNLQGEALSKSKY